MRMKVLTTLLVLVMMFSLASISFASPVAPVEGPSSGDGGDFSILDTIYIDSSHSGKTAFDQSFTVSPDSDKNLNIWVKNDGSSSVDVFVEHIDSGKQYPTYTVGSGEQLTRTFNMPDGSYLYGEFRVYVYTTDGSEMNIKVRARGY
ncbi:hypothetical protein [Paenibacillus cisolokensis]|uniref:hypothetical protein n=1 Tax=Paenibacillus cisolokensis TaxID=1658519 RepID=UPI001BCC6F41|nr:hypothetical protein [Paenibacillus cisolokensis]